MSALQFALSTSGIVFMSIYLDTKFNYVPPAELGIKLQDNAPWWQRLILNPNHALKYGSLFMLWTSANLHLLVAERFHDDGSFFRYLLIAVMIISVLVYLFVVGWSVWIVRSDSYRR